MHKVKKVRIRKNIKKKEYPKEFLDLLEIQKNLYINCKEIVDVLSFNIKKTTEILERTEDTVCNVLLAIRQNQFLQAWYPAQPNSSEMYVSGSHPESYIGKKYENKM